jgi:hypothetical protein
MASKIDAAAITAVMKALSIYDPKIEEQVAAAKQARQAQRAVRDVEHAAATAKAAE